MAGFQMKRLGMMMEPEPGNPHGGRRGPEPGRGSRP